MCLCRLIEWWEVLCVFCWQDCTAAAITVKFVRSACALSCCRLLIWSFMRLRPNTHKQNNKMLPLVLPSPWHMELIWCQVMFCSKFRISSLILVNFSSRVLLVLLPGCPVLFHSPVHTCVSLTSCPLLIGPSTNHLLSTACLLSCSSCSWFSLCL